jgi:diguanylate cyclase (GGDEF)-like protein/PAS domain S-box-containing protein
MDKTSRFLLDAHLLRLRRDFVETLWKGMFLVAVIGVPISVSRSWFTGWLPVYSVHVALGALVVAVVLLHRRLPYPWLAGLFVALLWAVGLPGVLSFGLAASSIFWLVLGCFVASHLYSTRVGAGLAVAAALVLGLVGFGFVSGRLTAAIDEHQYQQLASSWLTLLIVTGSFIFFLLKSTGSYQRALVELLGEIQQGREQVADLYDRAPCGYYSLDASGRFVQLNATALAWLGCTEEDAVGRLGPRDFFTGEGLALFEANFATFLTQGHIGPLEFDLVSRDGTMRRISVSASALRDSEGRFLRSRSVMYDVTELSQARAQLRALNRQQEAMLDNQLVGITRLKGRSSVWTNRALERIFGYRPGELAGQPARLLYLDDESYEALGKAAYPVLSDGGTYRTQLRMARKDGSPIWIDLSGALVSPETGETMWLMLDITAMKERHEEVEQVAFHDALTGLPNRLLLADRLRQAIPMASRHGNLVAVCFIDLDGFKAVNDRLGHAAGDRMLQVVAERLRSTTRNNDTVARLGGDEFVLLLTDLQSRQECAEILTRVAQAVREPVDLGAAGTGHVSASIGVAYAPDESTDGERLLSLADEHMYAAKGAVRDRVAMAGNPP